MPITCRGAGEAGIQPEEEGRGLLAEGRPAPKHGGALPRVWAPSVALPGSGVVSGVA